MYGPLIICAALTGAHPAGTRGRAHPITTDDVVRDALAVSAAGASLIHLHARDAHGATQTGYGAYSELLRRLRATGCTALLSFSAGDDGGRATRPERWEVPSSRPEFVTLGSGSFNIGGRVYDNAPDYQRRLCSELAKHGVKAEIEVFDVGQLATVRSLVQDGLLTAPHHVQLVFGVPGGMPADVRLLPVLLQELPTDSQWTVSCQSADARVQMSFMTEAAIGGGHIRTGLEDHWSPADDAKVTNVSLVRRAIEIARAADRRIASSAEARRILLGN